MQRVHLAALALALGASACADQPTINYAPDDLALPAPMDLPLGGVDEIKTDGDWGDATTCKEIPALEPLVEPSIVISRTGLTLHLKDLQGTYDRVFPVGIGAIEDGESLTPTSDRAPGGVFYTRTDQAPVIDGPTAAQARWGWNHQCRMWWTDEDGDKVPVFAGLPFIRFQGPPTSGYGIHGPIDRYTRPSGGTLRQGYVSHGCIRMEAADVVEVYALIQGHKVAVKVQDAVERSDDGVAVDVEDTWMGHECQADGDCTFDGGYCKQNPFSGRGFCTQKCDLYCPDKYGHAPTFCVTDPIGDDGGICLNQVSAVQGGCRRWDGFVETSRVSRNGMAYSRRNVCMPGSAGWIGDRCQRDGDCMSGTCDLGTGADAGFCTEACSRYCPDLAGHAGTFCVAASETSGLPRGQCAARCGSSDDCPLGTTCEVETRYGQAWVETSVCLPD